MSDIAKETFENGGTSAFGVFTLPKLPATNLDYQYHRMIEVLKRFRRKCRSIENRHGIKRSFKAIEETYSEISFWHVHVNFVWCFTKALDARQWSNFHEEIVSAWLDSAALYGTAGTSRNAQWLKKSNSLEGTLKWVRYICKFSFYPEFAPKIGPDGVYVGLTPWGILEMARQWPANWKKVWNEYENAAKGLRRFGFFE